MKDEESKPKAATPKAGTSKDDPYDASTDEEGDNNGQLSDDGEDKLPELPDFFTSKVFFLYGDFKPADRRVLNRFIIAYDGLVILLPNLVEIHVHGRV